MGIKEVTRHAVAGRRIEQALEDMWGRSFDQWHEMQYGDMPLRRGLRQLGEALADHVAARTVPDPALLTAESRTALLTAAECALGVLELGCWPDGDFEVLLPIVSGRLSNDELHYDERWEPAHPATTARTWIDAFAWCVISGLIWERGRVIGPVLHENCAPAIRDGVPYSKRESVSPPADLAEMDALCGYLTVVHGPRPGALPGPKPLGKPDAATRTRTAGQLDAVGALTPDQQLLRVLLDDDQATFEQALEKRLVAYRENAGADPVPRSLLPVGAVALAALASLAHGWELGIRSPYLPESLMREP
ncbi:immunity 49 family protein [Streptomyces scabiei]|uniref:immunity 49 family protein n=1 Tax=Streptomyces scabiei TaxID=1930 RepID=UPI00298FE2FC|nr:immunity 49 family protein [Streptomyces scabiei]MDW8803690.1 immunity 49 family protein [Streptomyces scabiei]